MFDGAIRDHARWTPRAPAVVIRDQTVSYARFDGDIDRFAGAMAGLGVVRGCGVVSLGIEAAYLQFVALAALARLGVPSSPAADGDADLHLTDRAGAPTPGVARIDPDWTRAMLGAEPRPLPTLDLDPDGLVRVLLSSGTTGPPHRVPFSGRRIAANGDANLRVYGAGRMRTWVPLTGIDSLLGFHMAVLGWSLGAAVANGLPMSALPALMESESEGLIGATPAKLRALLAVLPTGFQPRPGWRVIVAGSALPAALARQAALRLTPDVRVQYGATESCQIAAGRSAQDQTVPGLVGITPAGAVVRVVDEAGRPLPDGQSGEIQVRGERTAPGYLGDPEAAARRFRDGWFHTLDLGRRLPDGRVVVEGRLDDRMNLDGRKVMPGPLEAAALDCPGVLDAAAFAAPDGDGIDHCWLAVVTAPGFDRDTLAAHLAAYDDLPPNRFAWTAEIPRNAMGKVERQKLRDALIAAIGAGAP